MEHWETVALVPQAFNEQCWFFYPPLNNDIYYSRGNCGSTELEYSIIIAQESMEILSVQFPDFRTETVSGISISQYSKRVPNMHRDLGKCGRLSNGPHDIQVLSLGTREYYFICQKGLHRCD